MGISKGFGVALIAMGGISLVLGGLSMAFCLSYVKYVGAPIWAGLFLMLTGSVGLMTGFRPKSNGWLTGFLVLSVLALVVVFVSFWVLLHGLVHDGSRLHGGPDDFAVGLEGSDVDYLPWPELCNLFDGSDYDSSSSLGEIQWDEWDGIMDHLNLPEGWEERPDEMLEWLNNLDQQNIEELDLPDRWQGVLEQMQGWANQALAETQSEDVALAGMGESRRRGGGRHRPNGERDHGEDWYDDYRSYDHGGKRHIKISVALFGVALLLAFAEFVVVFASSAAACCGLCNTPKSHTSDGKNGVPDVFVMQPGQTMLPQTNGKFVILQRPPSYLDTNFTPSTNPALNEYPTKAPGNRLPPLLDVSGLEEAEPLPEKVALA